MNLQLFFRRFVRDKSYMILSLSGLIIGLSTSFIIALYLINELSYDGQNLRKERIVKVITDNRDHQFLHAQSSYLLGPAAQREIPEIEQYCRSFTLAGSMVKKDNQWIEENYITAIDTQLIEIFTIPFIEGSIIRRDDIKGICISDRMAIKYFATTDVIGKTLLIKNKGTSFLMTIRGVFKAFPVNSTIRMDAIVSMELGHRQMEKYISHFGSGPSDSTANQMEDQWDYCFYTTYLLLKAPADLNSATRKLNSVSKKYQNSQIHLEYRLQQLTDVYLGSKDIVGVEGPTGSRSNIYIYLLVSVLVIIASGLNYVILATARALTSIRDLGIYRVLGAGQFRLMQKFIGEALLTNLLALPLSLMLSELLLPSFNELMGTQLAIQYNHNIWFLLVLLFVPAILGCLTGLLTSAQVFKYSTIEIIKNSLQKPGRTTIKKILIQIQIAIFIGLLASVLIIRAQIKVFLQTELGFNTQDLLIIPFPEDNFGSKYEAFKAEISSYPEISSVSGAFRTPPDNNVMSMQIKHPTEPDKMMVLEFMPVDYNFIETMGMTILAGRSFSKEFPSDREGVILNESAVKEMNLKEAVGTSLPFGTVIGVVKDFHLHPFQEPIKPAYLTLAPEIVREIIVKAKPGQMAMAIEILRKNVLTLTGKKDFRFNVYSRKIADLYMTELRLKNVIVLFSLLSLFLAVLGLYGLATFATTQRTKEIGIRKVNGASTVQIIRLLSKDVVIWVIVSAAIVSGPVWFLLDRWLQNYSYHAKLTPFVFILATGLTIIIALATTIGQAWKTARKNPVDTLHYE
jgi:putative ABC transport system permease protein